MTMAPVLFAFVVIYGFGMNYSRWALICFTSGLFVLCEVFRPLPGIPSLLLRLLVAVFYRYLVAW